MYLQLVLSTTCIYKGPRIFVLPRASKTQGRPCVLCLIGYRRLREYQTKMFEHIDLQKIGMARVEFSS